MMLGVLAIELMWRRESAGSTSAIKLSHPIQRTLLGDGRWDGKRSFGFALDGVRVAEKAILNIGRNCETRIPSAGSAHLNLLIRSPIVRPPGSRKAFQS
jgi:hypothetical protein